MLELEHVHKSYDGAGGPVRAVKDVCMSVERSEFIAIFGPSGSGKSTLLSLAAGLIHPDSGSIRFDGAEIGRMSKREVFDYRRTKLGLISQSFNLEAGLTAEENVAIPLLLCKVKRSEIKGRVEGALAEVGLAERAGHTPDRLSGGEQQRVAIARALVGEPRLILADEPTGNLDSEKGQQVLKLLQDMALRHGTALIVVTHDPAVADFADRIERMLDGTLVSESGMPAVTMKS